MPYFSYISMLHLYESLGWWRAGAELRRVSPVLQELLQAQYMRHMLPAILGIALARGVPACMSIAPFSGIQCRVACWHRVGSMLQLVCIMGKQDESLLHTDLHPADPQEADEG